MLDRSIPPHDVLMRQTQNLLLRLLDERVDVVRDRNLLVDRPFFSFRPRLKKMVEEIDANLNRIDQTIKQCRNAIVGEKKIVRGSKTEVRFYRYDGWTKECLESYVDKKSLYDSMDFMGDKKEESYFFIGGTAKVRANLLYTCEVASILRIWDSTSEEDERAYFCNVLARKEEYCKETDEKVLM